VRKRIGSGEASEAGRKVGGDATLSGVLDNLNRRQPGLHEVQRRLAGVLVKFAEADGKKPKFKRQKNPVLIQYAFYILSPKLLDACMAVLPVFNTEASAIAVDAASQEATPPQGAIETVQIKDVGTFSSRQIEVFKRCQNLNITCDLGIDMHKWLYDDGLPSLPAQYHDLAKDMARDIPDSYPYKELENLQHLPEYTYTLLYRLTPPTWLTDAALRACCDRLVMDNPVCRFAGLQTASTTTKRTRSKNAELVDVSVHDRVMAQVQVEGVDTVFIPVSFRNAHWCCLVIKVEAKRIFFYDPPNQAPYINACSKIATNLKVSGL
jgi:hypothetical protein